MRAQSVSLPFCTAGLEVGRWRDPIGGTAEMVLNKGNPSRLEGYDPLGCAVNTGAMEIRK